MIKRIGSLTLVLVLISTMFATSAFAKVFSEDEVKVVPNRATSTTAAEPANEKLRTAITKLVSDAKAGKIAPAPRPQTQSRNTNNLSKGTKIAIGVGIVVAVVAIIVVAKADKGPTGPITVF
jgi:hypothetical protein